MRNLTRPRSRVFRTDWFNWRSSAIIDSVALIGGTALTSVLANAYELGPQLFQLGREHAEIDDIIFVGFVLIIGLMIYILSLSRSSLRSERTDHCRTRSARTGAARFLDRAAQPSPIR